MELVLAPGTDGFRDEIVAAFCVLEPRLRTKEQVPYPSVGKAVFSPGGIYAANWPN